MPREYSVLRIHHDSLLDTVFVEAVCMYCRSDSNPLRTMRSLPSSSPIQYRRHLHSRHRSSAHLHPRLLSHAHSCPAKLILGEVFGRSLMLMLTRKPPRHAYFFTRCGPSFRAHRSLPPSVMLSEYYMYLSGIKETIMRLRRHLESCVLKRAVCLAARAL